MAPAQEEQDFVRWDNSTAPAQETEETVWWDNSTAPAQEEQDFAWWDNSTAPAQETEETVWWNNSSWRWANLGLWIVAGLLSAILFFGLLIPLLLEMKRGQLQMGNSNSSLSRSKSRRRRLKANYSTFNVYLMYLAMGDFLYSLCAIYASLLYNFLPFDRSAFILLRENLSEQEWLIGIYFSCVYGLANILLNASMCHQIKVLLLSSKRLSRLKQPCLLRVNLQGAAAYLLPAIFLSGIFFPDAWLITYCIFGIVWFVILFYIIYVTVVVWYGDYIPPVDGGSANARAARELALYFYRICGTFLGIYIPSAAFSLFAGDTGQEWWQPIQGLLLAIQPIVTFCFILEKSDTRKYIMDLVTLTYVFGDWRSRCNCLWRKKKAVPRHTRTTRMSTISILGFDVEEEEEEEDSNSANGDAGAKGGSDAEAEPSSDVVADAAQGGDIESGKRAYSSRRNQERPTAVLMTGETKSTRTNRTSQTSRTARTVDLAEEEHSNSDNGDAEAEDGSDADYEIAVDVVGDAGHDGDLESGKHPYTSRQNEDRRSRTSRTAWFDLSEEGEFSNSENGDAGAEGGSDANAETDADDVGDESQGGDLESGKRPYTSRQNEERPVAVLMTGETTSRRELEESTAWSGASDKEFVP